MSDADAAGAGKDRGLHPPTERRRRRLRRYADVEGATGSGIEEQVRAQRDRLAASLAGVGALVVVASGKGGVGKSAVTANLAVSLAARGARVGVVDADLNGPSLGMMLGLRRGRGLSEGPDGIVPAVGVRGVVGVSMDLFLDEGVPLSWKGPESDRFVWQGVSEAAALREFLSDVDWGALDYLVVDVPPGTDKIGRFLDLVPHPDQGILVTIPSPVAGSVVSRSATALRAAALSALGVVGNMSGYAPAGQDARPLFGGAGAPQTASALGLDVWAEIPFDPELGARTDAGEPPGGDGDSPACRAFATLALRVERGPGGREAA